MNAYNKETEGKCKTRSALRNLPSAAMVTSDGDQCAGVTVGSHMMPASSSERCIIVLLTAMTTSRVVEYDASVACVIL